VRTSAPTTGFGRSHAQVKLRPWFSPQPVIFAKANFACSCTTYSGMRLLQDSIDSRFLIAKASFNLCHRPCTREEVERALAAQYCLSWDATHRITFLCISYFWGVELLVKFKSKGLLFGPPRPRRRPDRPSRWLQANVACYASLFDTPRAQRWNNYIISLGVAWWPLIVRISRVARQRKGARGASEGVGRARFMRSKHHRIRPLFRGRIDTILTRTIAKCCARRLAIG
jgi:hypothetical protein